MSDRPLLEHVLARSSAPAVISPDRTLSWAELDDESAAVAGAWAAGGVLAGDRVALVAENHWRAVVAILAAHRLGAVLVPANPGYGHGELSHVLTDCEPTWVVADEARAPLVAACGHAPRSLAPDPAPTAPLAPSTGLSMLIYTSGTTGRSKGCMLSFENVAAGVTALSGLWGIGPRDTIVHALPLFHVHGLCVALHGALIRGATTRMVYRFAPTEVVRAIAEGGTVFMGVPTMFQRLVAHLDAHPEDGRVLAGARLFCCGSAALAPDLLARFRAHTGHTIVERYGMSETLITLSNPLAPVGARKAGAVGHPIDGVEIRVVDDHGGDVVRGESGELWVRGRQVMSGYWRDPAATAKVLTADGWLKTGDLVRQDDDGAVRIVGRLSTDILKVGGYKISAREVEEAVAALPWVREVAVVGVPDEEWGQKVVACLVLAEVLPEDEILARLAGLDLHAAKRPRAVVLVDELPRNAMGKVQKHLLAARVGG